MKKSRVQISRSTRSVARVTPSAPIKPPASSSHQKQAAPKRLAMLDRQAIRDYLERSTHLAKLCSQNGWVDNESLTFEVRSFSHDEAVVTVYFDEVIEAAGRAADRVACFGKLRVLRDGEGVFVTAEII